MVPKWLYVLTLFQQCFGVQLLYSLPTLRTSYLNFRHSGENVGAPNSAVMHILLKTNDAFCRLIGYLDILFEKMKFLSSILPNSWIVCPFPVEFSSSMACWL